MPERPALRALWMMPVLALLAGGAGERAHAQPLPAARAAADSSAATVPATAGSTAVATTLPAVVATTTATAASTSTPTSTPTPTLIARIDLEAPRRLLDMVDRGAVSDDEIAAWVALPANAEVLAQGVPAQHLAANVREVVAGTASERTQTLGRPGTVRMEPRAAWRRILARLEARAPAITARVTAAVAPYVPPGYERRPLPVYLHLAGGWDVRVTDDAIYINLTWLLDTPRPDAAAVDGLLARGLASAVQTSAHDTFIDFSARDPILLTGMQIIFNQGFARFVERRVLRAGYPEGTRAFEELQAFTVADREVGESLRRLDRYAGMAATASPTEAESLLVESVRDGSFPAIGDLVCRTVQAAGGAEALVRGFTSGPVAVFRRYGELAGARADLPELPLALAVRLDAIAADLQGPWLEADAERRAAFVAFDDNDYQAALEPLRRIQEILPGNPIDLYNLACALSMTGSLDLALETLETAIEGGFRDAEHIRGDADLAPLHALPGYAALLERLEGGAVGAVEAVEAAAPPAGQPGAAEPEGDRNEPPRQR